MVGILTASLLRLVSGFRPCAPVEVDRFPAEVLLLSEAIFRVVWPETPKGPEAV